jgi:aspartyl-tRNA(Asn)/glutamyl-tRNA(Gln) amidotransferase subunit A
VSELTSLSVTELGDRLRRRETSSLAVTQAYLDRIAAVDGKLGSYLTVVADLALEAARRADAEAATGRWRGPFHGVPIGLKDLIYVRGLPTTAGSRVLADFRPDYDATVWKRLADAGAILLGKLNLNEFAYGGLNLACRNPYALDHLPGGSSAGSGAAVAGRTCAAALGTDTSGSIRIPAAACGCVGLKPTWSRVSRHGVIPLARSMDCVGPMTRTVRDAALMLQVIAGHDPDDSTSSGEAVGDFAAAARADVRGLRVGVIRQLSDRISPEVDRLFKVTLQRLAAQGARVDEVSIPPLEIGALINNIVTSVEALEYHQAWLAERRALYGADCRLQLEAGMMVPATAYVRAQRGRARILAAVLKALDAHDVLVSPGAAATATAAADFARDPKAAADAGYRDMLRFTQPFDATGQPALTVPTGLTSDGLPAAIQIVGRPFDEAMLFRVGAAVEAARGAMPPASI